MTSSAHAHETQRAPDALPADSLGTSSCAEALSSVALLQGNASIEIDHLGTRYVLRATRAGKLILTK